jgi:hypothetical protein
LKLVSFESDISLWSSSIGLKFWTDIEDIYFMCFPKSQGFWSFWKRVVSHFVFRSQFWKDIKAKVLKWSKYNLGDFEGRSLKIRKRKSVRTTTMDNSESNIDLTQILAALQHLQQKKSCLETQWPAYRISHHLLPQYFLLLQWSPQSPRSVCQKSLMEHASNFEALLTRYAWSCNYTPVIILMTPLV